MKSKRAKQKKKIKKRRKAEHANKLVEAASKKSAMYVSALRGQV